MNNGLINFREKFNLTQYEVAKILNIDRTTYAGWEIRKKIIPLKHLNTLSNKFEVRMDYLAGLTRENNINSDYKKISLDKSQIGKKLKYTRIKNNLTQKDIAKKLNTTQSTVSAYENGKTLILTAFIIDFAKVTNTSIDWLCNKLD